MSPNVGNILGIFFVEMYHYLTARIAHTPPHRRTPAKPHPSRTPPAPPTPQRPHSLLRVKMSATVRPGDELAPAELRSIRDQAGRITLVGFGSLLSEASAQFTFPDLTGFRVGRLRDWRRVFAHTTSVFFVNQIANMDTMEIASLRCGLSRDSRPDRERGVGRHLVRSF